MNSIKLDTQLPFEPDEELLEFFIAKITNRTIAPESNRMIVKLGASMLPLLSANRFRTEFAAKAIRAKMVRIEYFIVLL